MILPFAAIRALAALTTLVLNKGYLDYEDDNPESPIEALKQQRPPTNKCTGKPVGWTMPNPGVCDTYIECVHGYPMVRPCAPGTWFDSRTRTCTWPHLSDCEMDDYEDDEDDSRFATTTTTTTTTIKPTAVTTRSTLLDRYRRVCAERQDPTLTFSGLLFENPFNRHTYVECAFGQPLIRACPDDTYFDPTDEICVAEESDYL